MISPVSPRQVESLRGLAGSQRFLLEATYVTLTSNVVAAAVQEASVRAQIAATKDIIAISTRSLELLRRQFDLDVAALHLPQDLPVGLPSRLVEQRPDVRAAEEQLHAASAQIGVAIANRLPQFTLSGAYGGVASRFTQMFARSRTWRTPCMRARMMRTASKRRSPPNGRPR